MDTPLNDAHIRFADFAGIPTRYYDEGEGDPVLLLHGGHFGFGIPLGIECWTENIPALATASRVIALDKLGQGLTDGPSAPEEWTMERVTDHACAFVEGLDLTRLTLVGHSRGALLAVLIAMRLPERVRQVVLVSTATLAPKRPDAPGSAFYENLFATAPVDKGPAAVVEHYIEAQALVPENWKPSFVEAMAEQTEDPRWQATQARYHEADADTHWTASVQQSSAAALEDLRTSGSPVPVRIVWGAQDRSAPVFLGFDLLPIISEATDDVEMFIINRAGHHVFRDQPAAFNRYLLSVLAE